MADNNTNDQSTPKPDAALQRLIPLLGKWQMKGRPLGAADESIKGVTEFKWLHGEAGNSFFMLQDMEMDYAGTVIKSREIIGYNPKSKAFSSYVFSNMAAEPWPYSWDIQGDEIIISISFGPMNATFHGRFSPDGKSFSGGWRPNAGADETINAPYDITATRID